MRKRQFIFVVKIRVVDTPFS